jgi:hypothetical protein
MLLLPQLKGRLRSSHGIKWRPKPKPNPRGLLAPSPQEREREREQGRGSVFPQTLLLPLDPEVAGTAEGLVDAGRDAGAVHLPLHAASQLLLLVS